MDHVDGPATGLVRLLSARGGGNTFAAFTADHGARTVGLSVTAGLRPSFTSSPNSITAVLCGSLWAIPLECATGSVPDPYASCSDRDRSCAPWPFGPRCYQSSVTVGDLLQDLVSVCSAQLDGPRNRQPRVIGCSGSLHLGSGDPRTSQDPVLQGGGPMKPQSATGVASSHFLGKVAISYCCTRRAGLVIPEMTVIGSLGTASSWPLGWPTNEHSNRYLAVPTETGNRWRRRHLHRRAGARRIQ